MCQNSPPMDAVRKSDSRKPMDLMIASLQNGLVSWFFSAAEVCVFVSGFRVDNSWTSLSKSSKT